MVFFTLRRSSHYDDQNSLPLGFQNGHQVLKIAPRCVFGWIPRATGTEMAAPMEDLRWTVSFSAHWNTLNSFQCISMGFLISLYDVFALQRFCWNKLTSLSKAPLYTHFHELSHKWKEDRSSSALADPHGTVVKGTTIYYVCVKGKELIRRQGGKLQLEFSPDMISAFNINILKAWVRMEEPLFLGMSQTQTPPHLRVVSSLNMNKWANFGKF